MLCDYGCGSEGLFLTSSGKNCCNKNYAGCPAIKKKNASGVSKSWTSGKKTMPDDYVPHNKGTINPNPKADFSLNGKGNHKRVLITERGHICESCKNTEWLNEPIPIELEHIDGNNKNNVKENLQLLCPNCHAKTSTYRGKNARRDTNKKVSDSDLLDAINKTGSISAALESVGLVAKGGNYNRCYKLMRV
jgi:5-methylcytosine-specific restriction endonuclease McrA